MPQEDTTKEKEFDLAFGNFINLVNSWVLGSITETYRATKHSENNSSPLVAFILISTTIDFVAGFFEGITDLDNPGNAGRTYKRFLERYMPGYNSENLYKDLRCKLAHNFTIGASYALIHKRYDMHGKIIPETGQIIINFENFYTDFENAIKAYISDLVKDQDLKSKFLTRYRLGIPAVFQIKGEIS